MKRGCDMRIDIRFLCPELVDTMNSGFYAVPEGATVRDLFHVCLRENQVEFEEDWLKRLLFLADGKPVGWDTGLDGVKKVLVLHAV
jgi:hypothetical protein